MQQRQVIALSLLITSAVIAVSLLALGINTYDWGVALMFLAPFVVYGLIRLWRVLDNWANAQ